MITVKALETEIEVMLKAYRVPFRKEALESNLPNLYIIEDFGVIISGFERVEYTIVANRIATHYKGYRFIPITTMDNMNEKKDEVLWELMRSGYMRYIRTSYPGQFKTLLTQYGLGRKIINERLRIWGDAPKYKYLVEENRSFLGSSEVYALSMDPAFYDFMPEAVSDQQGG